MSSRTWKTLIWVGALIPFAAGAIILMRSKAPSTGDPFAYSWGRAIPEQSVPEGLAGIRASDCGVCHKAIYAEWRVSTHAKALVDPQFQFEWAKDQHLWLCLNCHIPLTNQQTVIINGVHDGDLHRPVVEQNPSYDGELAEEGITCAVCHVREGTVIGLFGDSEAPHPVKVAPDMLSFEACLNCHNALGRFGGTLVCNFDTGDDWRRTDLAGSDEDCLHCHMPPVTRPFAHGSEAKDGRSHTWYGAGIPKFFEDGPSIPPRSGLEIEIVPNPAGYRPGEKSWIAVNIANQHAGHSVPTGDVERFVMIHLRLTNEDLSQDYWERDERIGEVWVWSPEARQVSDNSLAFGEERTYRYEIDIPQEISDLAFEVIVENHRMTTQNAQEMGLMGKYPLKREVLRKTASLMIRGDS
jgi:hypothetical protein